MSLFFVLEPKQVVDSVYNNNSSDRQALCLFLSQRTGTDRHGDKKCQLRTATKSMS
jgi:hypothetical protein